MCPIKNCLKCMFRMPNQENDWLLVVVDVFVVGAKVTLDLSLPGFYFHNGVDCDEIMCILYFLWRIIQAAWNRLNMFNRILKFLHFIMLHDSQYGAVECQPGITGLRESILMTSTNNSKYSPDKEFKSKRHEFQFFHFIYVKAFHL